MHCTDRLQGDADYDGDGVVCMCVFHQHMLEMAKVKVFQADSRNYSMMLTITEQQEQVGTTFDRFPFVSVAACEQCCHLCQRKSKLVNCADLFITSNTVTIMLMCQ